MICWCWFISDRAVGSDSLSLLLPSPADGWTKAGAPEMYDRQNIFDYLDGGAEIYLAYDFKQLVVQKYTPPAQDSLQDKSITVEIWQMSSLEDVYGVWSLDREGENVSIGQDGVYGDGSLRFWKDVYFVKVFQAMESSKETILQLGRRIDRGIQNEGKLPLLVQRIPTDSLVTKSVHYFHQQINLNDLYPFPEQNQLNLSRKTSCVLAEFWVCDDHLRLLLIQYPKADIAESIEKKLKGPYLTKGALSSDNLFMSKDNGLVGVDLLRNYLVLVLGGKDKQNIQWLLASVKSAIDGSKNMEKPECFRYR